MKAQLSLFGFFTVIAMMIATLAHWPQAPSSAPNPAIAVGAPVNVPASPAAPAAPKTSPTAAAPTFASRLQEIFESLPTNAQVEARRPSPENSPPEIFVASDKLGEIREVLQKDPEAAPQAAIFYDQCARKRDVLLSIRSLCLRNLFDLQAQLTAAETPRARRYDQEVLSLAKSIPPMPFDLAR